MNTVLRTLFEGINVFIEVLCWILLADSVLSWVAPMGKLRSFTSRISEPVTRPFRNLLLKMTHGNMRVDLSPSLAILFLLVVTVVLSSLITVL